MKSGMQIAKGSVRNHTCAIRHSLYFQETLSSPAIRCNEANNNNKLLSNSYILLKRWALKNRAKLGKRHTIQDDKRNTKRKAELKTSSLTYSAMEIYNLIDDFHWSVLQIASLEVRKGNSIVFLKLTKWRIQTRWRMSLDKPKNRSKSFDKLFQARSAKRLDNRFVQFAWTPCCDHVIVRRRVAVTAQTIILPSGRPEITRYTTPINK